MTPGVGFAGLGLMGQGMASTLLAKGFPLSVLGHRKREAIEDPVGRGAVEVDSAREAPSSTRARASIRRDAATLDARRAVRRSPAASRSSRVILIAVAMPSARQVQRTANYVTAAWEVPESQPTQPLVLQWKSGKCIMRMLLRHSAVIFRHIVRRLG